MKISKVKHTRAAVSKCSGDGSDLISGILYNNPAQGGIVKKDLKPYIEELNYKSQVLYNVFNSKTKKKTKKEDFLEDDKSDGNLENESYERINKMILNFNKITKWLLEMNDNSSEENVIIDQLENLKEFTNKQIKVWKDKTKSGKQFKIAVTDVFSKEALKQTVKKIVVDYLRNSLRIYVKDTTTDDRIYIPNIIEQLMYAFCLGNEYYEEFNKISKDRLVLVLKAMNNDYTKKKHITGMVKSIENQNVKVQPDVNGILKLSGAEHINEKRDYKSKKYIFEFVKEYACLDKESQMKKLLHMRQLIVLFFYGEGMYKKLLPGLTALSFGKQLEVDESVFSDEAFKTLEINSEEKELNNKTKQAEVKEFLRKEICVRYNKFFADKVVALENADYFWLNWIIGEVEKLFYGDSNDKKTFVKKKYLYLVYLCKRIWNNWTAFIAMKYVDMGKAVYHFAMPKVTALQKGENIAYGKILPEYQKGLTSFDYERIKAEETLERDIMTYITFAINTFSQATIGEQYRISEIGKNAKKEDVLYNPEFLKESYTDSTRRILQYFGGKSRWTDSDVLCEDRIKLLETMRQALKFIRDGSAHYTAVRGVESDMDVKLLRKMFDAEVSNLGRLYSEKYCSNNATMFYSVNDIIVFMKNLYQKNNTVKRMPAFKTVINRSKMREIIRELVGTNYFNVNISKMNTDIMSKLEATQYFLLREIYYNDFIVASDKELMKLFCNEVFALDREDKKYGNAAKDFQGRIKRITQRNYQCTLETLCEIIMTDYNMQNTEKERLASKDVGTDKDRKLYKHFPMLLRQCIGNAFLKYVKKQEVYQFLKKPQLCENNDIIAKAEAELLEKGNKIHSKTYEEQSLKQDDRLMAWYVVVHFLSPKYLNQLNGVFFSYIQYVNSINNRAALTGNLIVDYHDKIEYYQNIILILNLVRNYAGRISAEITDYFDGDTDNAYEEYARYISDYVEFYKGNGRSYTMALKEFSMQKVEIGSPSGYVEIYFDGGKPKLNRNIILSMLFGNIKSVREKFSKITLQEINQYYEQQEKLKFVLQSGICKTKEEQFDYKQLQLQKNRIELVDVRVFTEIINDLYAKLISWSYLRERDLLYFHLGIHYLRMQYSDNFAGILQKEIQSKNVKITEAGILYQFLALYTHSLPLYELENNAVEISIKKGAVGTKIGKFLKIYGVDTYTHGLELFEYQQEHEDIVKIRNYFDHFKYYANAEYSIMDMYGEVYDRFFSYDLKLKKSVTYILEDILKSYFVISTIRPGKVQSISVNVVSAKDKYKRKTCYPEIYGKLESDELTYRIKVKNKKGEEKEIKNKVPARTDMFLKQLKEILEYRSLLL